MPPISQTPVSTSNWCQDYINRCKRDSVWFSVFEGNFGIQINKVINLRTDIVVHFSALAHPGQNLVEIEYIAGQVANPGITEGILSAEYFSRHLHKYSGYPLVICQSQKIQDGEFLIQVENLPESLQSLSSLAESYLIKRVYVNEGVIPFMTLYSCCSYTLLYFEDESGSNVLCSPVTSTDPLFIIYNTNFYTSRNISPSPFDYAKALKIINNADPALQFK